MSKENRICYLECDDKFIHLDAIWVVTVSQECESTIEIYDKKWRLLHDCYYDDCTDEPLWNTIAQKEVDIIKEYLMIHYGALSVHELESR